MLFAIDRLQKEEKNKKFKQKKKSYPGLLGNISNDECDILWKKYLLTNKRTSTFPIASGTGYSTE